MSLFSWFRGSSGTPCPACGAAIKSALAVVCPSCHQMVPFLPDQERDFAAYLESSTRSRHSQADRLAAEREGVQPKIGPLNDAELMAIRQLFGAAARARQAGKPLRVLLTLPPDARKGVVAFVGALPLIAELMGNELRRGRKLALVYAACDGPTKARASNTYFDCVSDGLIAETGPGAQPLQFIWWDAIGELLRQGPVDDKLFVIGDVDRHPTTVPRRELEAPATGSFSIFASNPRQNVLLMHATDLTSPFSLRSIGVER